MVATLPYDLRGLRDRAILLLGYAGGPAPQRNRQPRCSQGRHAGLRRLDRGLRQGCPADAQCQDRLARGRDRPWLKDQTCPVHALEQWLHFAKIDFGPVFVGTSRDGKRALEARLNDKHVARLIKRTVLDAGIRADLPEKERLALFSGHSLRAGLASSAEVDERYVQKQLGHASAEMTRRYQRRRDRFRINLTKAAGL